MRNACVIRFVFDPCQEKSSMNRNKHLIILVSFITAALLAAVIFVVSGIYPGSERTLLIFDMKEQFVSFYAYMSRVRRLSDLKYTFEGSLGTPLAGLIAYYLASPLSFIYLFFADYCFHSILYQ